MLNLNLMKWQSSVCLKILVVTQWAPEVLAVIVTARIKFDKDADNVARSSNKLLATFFK